MMDTGGKIKTQNYKLSISLQEHISILLKYYIECIYKQEQEQHHNARECVYNK